MFKMFSRKPHKVEVTYRTPTGETHSEITTADSAILNPYISRVWFRDEVRIYDLTARELLKGFGNTSFNLGDISRRLLTF